MEKVKFLPLALFSIFFAKILFVPATYVDCSILFIMGLVAGFFEFQSTDKKIKALEAKMEQAIRDYEDKVKDIDGIKGSINSLKLSGIGRPVSASR